MEIPRPAILCPAAIVISCLVLAPPAYAQCPITEAPNTGIEAKVDPGLWKVGESIAIRLNVKVESVAAACLDVQESLTVGLTQTNTGSDLSVTIPPTESRTQLTGVHTIRFRLLGRDKTTFVIDVAPSLTPALSSATFLPLSPNDRVIRVRLIGSALYQSLAPDYRLFINGRRRPICWTDDDCKLKKDAIAATFESEDSLVLSNIDLTAQEGSSRIVSFKLCNGAWDCTGSIDIDGKEASYFVRIFASLAVVLTIGIVFMLARSREGDELFRRKYVLASLVLDKESGTYSLSKLQFYIWTIVGVFSYAYLYASRMWFQAWSDLPPLPAGLPGIIAIAGGATVGAQVITQMNGPKGSGEVHPRLGDFISTGGMVTAERVQFFVWTIVGAASFLIAVFMLDPRTLIELPSVPESVLAISGISAFGYLGGKLARTAGPVINEVIIRVGPDPDVVASTGAPPTNAGPANAVAKAATAVQAAKLQFQLSQSQALQAVFAAAKTAMDAADAAIAAAQPPAGSPFDKAKVTTQLDAGEKAVVEATRLMQTLKSQGSLQPADVVSGEKAVAAADAAAKAVDALVEALNTTTSQVPTGEPRGGNAPAVTKFGILELRGRTLSQDATFHLSKAETAGTGEVKITFDMLEPAPDDQEKRQKPRIVARDDDAGTDVTLAKHLRLVIRMNDAVAAIFQSGTKHTVTVHNPDSQSVAYKFDVK